MWRNDIQRKFKEKFPNYYEGCKDGKWYFLQSSNMCAVDNKEIGAVCIFTYKNEKEFSLEIRKVKGKLTTEQK